MSKTNPHLYYPPEIYAYADDAERASIHEENLRYLDCEAAMLLDSIANHHRDDWEDPKFAVFARRVMRQVADHLRSTRA